MKRRRNLLVVLLALCTLCVGVGYAAMADDLFVDVTANFNPTEAEEEFKEDVYFATGTGNAYCNAGVSGDNDRATIQIGGDGLEQLTTREQSAEATFEVQNDYQSAVKITDVTVDLSALSTYYNVAVDVTGAQNIAAGGKGTIIVTITPKATITTAINNEQFTIDFSAELVTNP